MFNNLLDFFRKSIFFFSIFWIFIHFNKIIFYEISLLNSSIKICLIFVSIIFNSIWLKIISWIIKDFEKWNTDVVNSLLYWKRTRMSRFGFWICMTTYEILFDIDYTHYFHDLFSFFIFFICFLFEFFERRKILETIFFIRLHNAFYSI